MIARGRHLDQVADAVIEAEIFLSLFPCYSHPYARRTTS
jgi:hypothetical protein